MRNLSKAEEIAEREAEAICSDCGLYVYDVEYKKRAAKMFFACSSIRIRE